jgi:hypothetical protein
MLDAVASVIVADSMCAVFCPRFSTDRFRKLGGSIAESRNLPLHRPAVRATR